MDIIKINGKDTILTKIEKSPKLKVQKGNLIDGFAVAYYEIENIGKDIYKTKFKKKENYPSYFIPLFLDLINNKVKDNFDLICYPPSNVSGNLVKNFATSIAESLNIPVNHNLFKNKFTKPQKISNKFDDNLHEVFYHKNPSEIRGKKILLIDDVYKLGSTIKAIGKKLSDYGAEVVMPLTITKTISRENILGKRHLLEVGNINVDKIIYRPTSKLFKKFYDIIKTKPWFDKYNFIITGSFPNILSKNKQWETWDVDLNVMSNDIEQLDYIEIRDILSECSRIAIEECSIYVEVKYVLSQNYLKYINEINSTKHTNLESILEKYSVDCLSNVLSVKVNGKIGYRGEFTSKAEEIKIGLYKLPHVFPSEKHIKRRINNFTYSPPINIKDYFK